MPHYEVVKIGGFQPQLEKGDQIGFRFPCGAPELEQMPPFTRPSPYFAGGDVPRTRPLSTVLFALSGTYRHR
ncbi:MAG: hypothetical protein ACLRWQ_03535 [Flavonifractor plautii]